MSHVDPNRTFSPKIPFPRTNTSEEFREERPHSFGK